MPSAASAALYTVDSTADEADLLPGTGGCLTAGAKCTLRAAIEESNFSTGVPDEIKFDGTVFKGEAGDTIALGSGLPAIEEPVGVLGGDCFGEDGPDKPCVGVEGPSGAAAITVEDANEVVIEGLAVTGAQTAINVIDSSEEFIARNDWIGFGLPGQADGNTTGIFLDPDSDLAVIGGTEAKERNVFANNAGDGLDILGADNAEVLGNYFGVDPDGATQAANGKNIEITDSVAFEANGDQVGTTVEGAAATSQACDGGCNVVSGSTGTAIDLVGDGEGQNELPASGPTTVNGNYVGLNSGGVTPVSAGPIFDILAGAAEDVTVGGTAPGDANYIAGGSFGIYQENSDGFQALGNVIGRRPGGAGVAGTGSSAIFLFSLNSTGRETVEGNTIRIDGGIGIEQRFGGADIAGNSIEEGQYGIFTSGAAAAPGGNTIEENTILNAELNAVLIENENNLLVGNLIEGAGLAGVRIEGISGTGTLIGGDVESEENEISGNGGDAIEVADPEDTDTQIKRNFGAGNGGLFIDLGADGPGNSVSGPNDGIQAPKIDGAKLTGASGSGALPGAEVRIFRKATASPGEIASFLGVAKADGSGNWTVTYAAAIPGETRIAATQSALEGTSELAFATTEPAPKTVEEGAKEPKKEKQPEPKEPKGPKKPKTPKGGVVPETTITKGPRGRIHSRNVRFKFVSNVGGAKFECKLDRQKFKACKSPKKYKGLKPGKHVFKVRAVKGKAVDPTPAKRKFKILG
jgi:CSLREA domain-containing protein